jgi:diguanylate cyclase
MIEIISALTSGLLGILIGWLLRTPVPPRSAVDPLEGNGPAEPDFASIAQKIWDLTQEVSADVDLHQDRVRAADDVLRQSITGETPSAAFAPAIAQIIEASRDMHKQLEQAREKLHEQSEELQCAKTIATTDALTHLKNRRAYDEHVAMRYELRDQSAHPTALVMFDVDHFKQLNDTHGHQAGDQVLRRVASILYARLHHYGMAARYGGEEFAIVFDDARASQVASTVESVRQEISNRSVEIGEERVKITISCGMSELAPEDTVEQWVARADEALYLAKEHGRNRGYLNANGQMLPLAEENNQVKSLNRQIHLEAAELLKVGEQLYESLSSRDISMSTVIMSVDGSERGISEVSRIVRAQLRGIDRMGHLSESEIAIWMPTIQPDAAREWVAKFTTQYRQCESLSSGDCKEIKVGIAATESSSPFAQTVRTARENLIAI